MLCAVVLALAQVALPSELAFRVHGNVTVIDREGRTIEDPSGRFQLIAGLATGLSFQVEFTQGRYELLLPRRPGWLEAFGILGPHGIAIVDSSWLLPDPDWDSRFDLKAHCIEPCVLRVLDAESGDPLDCVDVEPIFVDVENARWFRALDGACVVLDPLVEECKFLREGEVTWRVQAAGRVDELVRIDPRRGGEFVVWMGPAGSLSLDLEGFQTTRHTYLEVASADSEFEWRAHVDPQSPPHFEGLRPGPYDVRVIHEFLDMRRTILSEQGVHVLSHELTAAKLVVAPPPADETDGPWEPVRLR